MHPRLNTCVNKIFTCVYTCASHHIGALMEIMHTWFWGCRYYIILYYIILYYIIFVLLLILLMVMMKMVRAWLVQNKDTIDAMMMVMMMMMMMMMIMVMMMMMMMMRRVIMMLLWWCCDGVVMMVMGMAKVYWQQLFGKNPLQVLSEIGGVCPAGVLVVLSIVFRWSLVSWWHFGNVSVVLWRCSVMFWVFCSCFSGVSVVLQHCSRGVLGVLTEWYFLDFLD